MERLRLPYQTLTFVAGGPCTGKSTLVDRIIPLIEGAMLVDKDNISDSMLKTPDRIATSGEYNVSWMRLTGPRQSITGEHYREHVSMQTYDAMLQIAATNLRFGLNPFLQGNYTLQISKGYFREVVFPFLEEKELSPRVKLILCYVDPRIMIKRMKTRNDPRDASKLASKKAMQDYLDKQDLVPAAIEDLDHIKIDSSRSIDEAVGMALKYLTKKNRY